MIVNHNTTEYRNLWNYIGANQFNGAFFYSKEICKNIIPNVKTDRNWITINIPPVGTSHSIVFIHNNVNPEEIYKWLTKFEDLIPVCGIPETCERVKFLGNPIYLPLSVDVENVKSYRKEKTKKRAYCGRRSKRSDFNFPSGTEFLEALPRTIFLDRLASYEEVYAVGRTAIEAKILGCKVLPYDPRFPNPERWEILDNKEASKILQEKLNEVEK